MVWRADDRQGDEAQKVRHAIVRFTRGAGMELGCGARKAFAHFAGVDANAEAKPDIVADCARISDKAAREGSDFIFSSHLLEHIEDHRAALADWWSCIKLGGHLVLYLPHADLYPRMGEPGANPDHKHDFLPADIVAAMREVGSWDLVVNEVRGGGTEYSFLQVYRKIEPAALVAGEDCLHTHAYSCDAPRPEKTVCVVRHGGVGDQLQAAYLFPELKRQGFHVTVLTTPKGREPIEHDPHVDDWFMVDKDQVPNADLVEFWRETAKGFTRFVNLNESVEGTFLALPGRTPHAWPWALRHKMMDGNYAEFAADLAEIPFVPEGQFYPSDDEKKWAADFVRELTVAMDPDANRTRAAQPFGTVLARPYIVAVSLSGSSPHKANPHMDGVILRILERMPRAVVLLLGAPIDAILEQGWDTHPRVRCLSGKLTIRQSLTLARHANLVLGPETGVLNSVAYEEKIAKVILLSHSSANNLTKHWRNTTALAGRAACHPCHQLHYTTEFCTVDPETHAATCQAGMHPELIFEPVFADYGGWARVQMLRAA